MNSSLDKLELTNGKNIFIRPQTGSWLSANKEDSDIINQLVENFKKLNVAELSNKKLITAKKIYQSGILEDSPLQKAKLSEHGRVRLVIIEPSQFCNLACTYCFEDNPIRGKKMTLQTADYVIEEIVKLPLCEKPVIEFNGGESLLNWDAIEKIITGLNLKIESNEIAISPIYTIQTSGTVFPTRAIDFLSKHGISIGISLDGPKEIQDKRRPLANGKGSYDKIIQNIKRLEDAKVSYGLLAIVESAEQLSQAYIHLRSLNPNAVRINLQRVNGRSTEHIPDNELRKIADEHYSCFIDDLDRMKQGEHPMRLADICSLIENICLEEKPYMCQRSPCGAGTEQITFDWKGNVWACQEFIGDKKFLAHDRLKDETNQKQSALEQCENSEAQKLFSTRDVNKIDDCSTCVVKNYCQSGCSATAWYSVTDESSRSMNVKTPHCQYYFRLIPKLFEAIVDRTDDVYSYVFSVDRGYENLRDQPMHNYV